MQYRIKPAEVNNNQCETVIKGTHHGVLSFSHEEGPYAVPMNHAYEDGRFLFHCAVGGKKIDYIRKSPPVVYTIMKYYGSPEEFQKKHSCHGKWESVIAYGTARYIEEPEQLKEVFIKFMKYYGKHQYEPKPSSLVDTRAIVMEVDHMTARRELENKSTEFFIWTRS